MIVLFSVYKGVWLQNGAIISGLRIFLLMLGFLQSGQEEDRGGSGPANGGLQMPVTGCLCVFMRVFIAYGGSATILKWVKAAERPEAV